MLGEFIGKSNMAFRRKMDLIVAGAQVVIIHVRHFVLLAPILEKVVQFYTF